ncbi:hypothetical protein PYJP_04180 [Pyrofollis japonicus]|uniref:hypothetical protein n=1 Tax=Pyrofollis japonicus TaxID=3060460 RepID=UPI00295A64D2|nr:hypothetical protein [Pyrofollis japonicus]BEP17066.1 hypothetical protein PYJP_04180 [Pyrofollis japonicus]
MQQLAYIVIAAAMVSVAYVFAKIFERAGFTKALLAISVLIDFYLIILWILGVDRPLYLVCTRIGCFTVTALMLFLPIKLLFTIYLVLRQEMLKRVLG